MCAEINNLNFKYHSWRVEISSIKTKKFRSKSKVKKGIKKSDWIG